MKNRNFCYKWGEFLESWEKIFFWGGEIFLSAGLFDERIFCIYNNVWFLDEWDFLFLTEFLGEFGFCGGIF